MDWYSVEWLAWPADWASLFGRERPLLLEIGFGSGQFLMDWARRRPEANLLGVEIGVPSLRNAARKVRRSGLGNVRLFQATAESVLHLLVAPATLQEVVINFPDPWPKKSHQGRRLINDTFLHLLATRMAEGAALDIATDHPEYAGAITACLEATPHFISRTGQTPLPDDPERVRTKYEQLALAEGRPPLYFKWQRNSVPATDHFPVPKEAPVPHVVLRVPADLDEIGRRFRPGPAPTDSAQVKFLAAYRAVHEPNLLIETYINEDPLKQRLCLELRRRETGEIVLGLHELGFPRPTPGVHEAVAALVRWLEAEFPATIVVHSALKET
jgi:tRNA (guanine-N7-)-methyltransferase